MYERRGFGWCSEEDYECVLIQVGLGSRYTQVRFVQVADRGVQVCTTPGCTHVASESN